MRVNMHWLREWVDAGVDAGAVAEELTTAGLEVDAVLDAGARFDGVVIVRVIDVKPHPEADRLKLCVVDDGRGRHEVVCGAPNAAEGALAAFAAPGARLPDGRVIDVVDVRGVPSAGMLCSAKELQLGEDSDGILLLEQDASPGVSLWEYLQLDDAVLDIDLTPNRGDCFSVIGVARELAVKRGRALRLPPVAEIPAAIDDTLAVELRAGAACPRFAGRVIRGLYTNRSSPSWMKERLRRAGVRAIHPIVDVTNYVMLELGQPLHAYDLSKLDGGIIVRFADREERLELLDGREVGLGTDVLAIADHTRPVGLAGIMGGAGTGVETDTRDVFLEAAFFAPQVIAGRARRFGLHTDAAVRFERGVDPELPARAIERATALLTQIAGGKAGPVVVTERTEQIPQPAPIRLRGERVRALLGLSVEADRIEELLGSLGMYVGNAGNGAWQVTPPSFRFDLSIEEDLIEEIGRVVGYDNIPITAGAGPAHPGTATETRLDEDRAADLLVARGYTEVVTYSFVDEVLEEAVYPGADRVRLSNPISSDMNVMRRSLWPGLLLAARQNLARQHSRLRFFEIGRQFHPVDAGVSETNVIAGLAVGPQWPEHWDTPDRHADFYDMKADIEALVALTGRKRLLKFRSDRHPALRPGQTARVILDQKDIGWLGILHPRLADRFDIRAGAVLFELDMDEAFEAEVPAFRAYSRFPHVRRDLAIVVDETVEVDALTTLTREAAGGLLQQMVVFDIYRGKGIDSRRKSVALGLILQDTSRTLTDADADRAVQSVMQSLERELGATIRT